MQRVTESQILEDYVEQRQRQESEQLQGKKQFLKQNILDVYQQEEQQIDLFLDFFLLYLRRNKGIDTQDHNLQLLSLAQLTQLVEEFRTAHPPSAPMVEVQNSLDVSMSRIVEKERFDAQKVHYGNGSWDYQLQGYEECRRVKPFFQVQTGDRSVMVVFDKQELRKVGGFFGIGKRTELWVVIRCNLFKETTSRCVQDFLALRRLLLMSFPFAFLYPLETAQKMGERVGEQGIRTAVAAECRRFITQVCRDEQLLQCFITHRFFKDPKPFTAFASTYQKQPAIRIMDIQNTDGCLQIEISDRNELMKRDYTRKGEQMEQLYIKLDQSNQRIAGKLKEAQAEIDRQQHMMQQVMMELTNANPLLRDGYKDVSSLLGGYRQLVKQCGGSLGSWLFLLQASSLQLAAPSRYSWNCFSNYAKDINSLSLQYSQRRKVFLEKQAKRLQGGQVGKEGKEQAGTAQFVEVNHSVISNMGISANSAKETVWIERCSKWQGYMNRQFTASFQRLLQIDQEALRNILKQATATRREMQRHEEAVIAALQALL